jgi:hypothetical protein
LSYEEKKNFFSHTDIACRLMIKEKPQKKKEQDDICGERENELL